MDAIFGKPETPEDQYAKAKADELARQARVDEGIDEIEDVFSQYDQDFYDKRSDAYMDYQAPQLQDQYKEGLKELQFALARGGRLNSSTEVAKKAGAAQDLQFQRQEMAERAMQAKCRQVMRYSSVARSGAYKKRREEKEMAGR
jgi:hypothetical protein